MDWLSRLNRLEEYPPIKLLRFACRPEIEYAFSEWSLKGGVFRRADYVGNLIGFTVHVNPSQTRKEQEVTLVHELFHIDIGTLHPKGQYVMHFLDDMMYRFVEDTIDQAAYVFCEKHSEFSRNLFAELMPTGAVV